MQPPDAAYRQIAAAILERFLWQNGRPARPRAELARIAAQLWAAVADHGFPPPLPPDQAGDPGELPEELCDRLVAGALAGVEAPQKGDLAVPVRQLVKASLNPEFRNCRNSYREASPDGSRRRQELARALKRASGSHCVDCPYWTQLGPGRHLLLLDKSWRPESRGLLAGRLDVFLPEDFRNFRQVIAVLRQRERPSSP